MFLYLLSDFMGGPVKYSRGLLVVAKDLERAIKLALIKFPDYRLGGGSVTWMEAFQLCELPRDVSEGVILDGELFSSYSRALKFCKREDCLDVAILAEENLAARQ